MNVLKRIDNKMKIYRNRNYDLADITVTKIQLENAVNEAKVIYLGIGVIIGILIGMNIVAWLV